jgi:hypothetical protein
MAEITGPDAPFGDFFNDVTDTRDTIRCLRPSPGRNGKTNWFAFDDWRRSLSCRTIKALSTKDHFMTWSQWSKLNNITGKCPAATVEFRFYQRPVRLRGGPSGISHRVRSS